MNKMEKVLLWLLLFTVWANTTPQEFVDNWRAWLRLFGLA